jgi:hypothetical protein
VSEADTEIRCGTCHATVPPGRVYCTHCGALISAAQLRSSAARRMLPSEFRDLIEAHMARLAMSPVPLSHEALKLQPSAKKLLEDLKPLDPEKPIPRALLERVTDWFIAARAALQGKRP